MYWVELKKIIKCLDFGLGWMDLPKIWYPIRKWLNHNKTYLINLFVQSNLFFFYPFLFDLVGLSGAHWIYRPMCTAKCSSTNVTNISLLLFLFKHCCCFLKIVHLVYCVMIFCASWVVSWVIIWMDKVFLFVIFRSFCD